jgi:hypothetical protein
MTTTVWGVVRDGRVVPSSPLPEGARVEIRLADPPHAVPDSHVVEERHAERGDHRAAHT